MDKNLFQPPSRAQDWDFAQNDHLKSILTHISDAILFVTLEGFIAQMNDAARKILQLQTAKKSFWDLLPDDVLGFSMKEALKFGISHKLLYKTFKHKELEITTTFLYEGPRSHHGLLVVLRDLTEKRQLQRLVNQNDRLRELGEMTAALAHEIRNPLGAIRGYASLLQRDLKTNPQLAEMALFIIEGAQILDKLVSSLLHFAKPLQVQLQATEIGSLLKQFVRFVKGDPLSPPQVRWVLHIPEDPIPAWVDPEALKSALLNLVFNAFQAMPQGGILSLCLLRMESCYQIAVSDTGIGMSEEQLQHLFTRFFTTKVKGHGLGLVETQKIVQAHGGTIDVRSVLGKGTTFTLTLPIKGAQ